MDIKNGYILVEPIEIKTKAIRGTLTKQNTQLFKVKLAEDKDLINKIIISNKFALIEVKLGNKSLYFVKNSDVILILDEDELKKFE